jgi:phenylalanine-4-hydroxylase
MIIKTFLRSPLSRQLLKETRLPAAISSSFGRCFSTELKRINDDNMNSHYEGLDQPAHDWSTFKENFSELAGKVNDPKEFTMYGEKPRTSVLMELTDRVGVLHDVLRFFWKYDVNVCRIESRPGKVGRWGRNKFDFFVDFEGSVKDANVKKLLDALKPFTDKLLILDEKDVHWFPRHISELDLIANRVLDAGTDLESDHPGFNDAVYRARRAQLAEKAMNHRWDQPIPTIDYSPEELNVWSSVWDRMEELWEKYACKEYLYSLELFKKNCGYDRNNIPQQEDISRFLQRRTGFRLRPVAGLLSSRDFLNGLAFRVFFCTQYIRHHSKPLYTPGKPGYSIMVRWTC